MGACGNYTTHMSYLSYMSNDILLPHGGYRKLLSFQTTVIIHDLTVEFVKRYIDYRSRTRDQMEQAARSGKQNITEASVASGTSKKTARASLEELLQDYEDFLRQHNLSLWDKNDSRMIALRAFAYKSDRSYMTYSTYMETPELAANCALCLINQANYLLDRQIKAVEKEFLENGGFTERLYQARKNYS